MNVQQYAQNQQLSVKLIEAKCKQLFGKVPSELSQNQISALNQKFGICDNSMLTDTSKIPVLRAANQLGITEEQYRLMLQGAVDNPDTVDVIDLDIAAHIASSVQAKTLDKEITPTVESSLPMPTQEAIITNTSEVLEAFADEIVLKNDQIAASVGYLVGLRRAAIFNQTQDAAFNQAVHQNADLFSNTMLKAAQSEFNVNDFLSQMGVCQQPQTNQEIALQQIQAIIGQQH